MKHQILIKLILIFLVSNTVLAQENSQSMVSKLNQDLDYFQKIIDEGHPVPYAHISKAQLDEIFAQSKFDSTQVLSYIELERRVRHILSKVACSHTSVVEPRRAFKKRFPLSFYAKDKRLFIIRDVDSLLDVSQSLELIDINGHSSEEIITKMLDYLPADGYSTTLKYILINSPRWFNMMYSFYFDSDTVKQIRFVNSLQDTVKMTLNLRDISTKKAKKVTEDYDSKFGDNVLIKYYKNDIAVLRIKSFSSFAPVYGTMVNVHRYKKALKEIEKRKVRRLILDLRYNGGGDGQSGYKLASRFIKEKHRVNIQYYGWGIFKEAVFLSKIKLILNFFLGDLFSLRIPTFKEQRAFITLRPKPMLYSGKVYVLVNGLTASTASTVASILKHKAGAVILGEETGGSENSLNGYIYPEIKLPNSGIKIKIPQYNINLGLSKKVGSGVVPDIKIDNRLEYTGEKNALLKKAIELINNDK